LIELNFSFFSHYLYIKVVKSLKHFLDKNRVNIVSGEAKTHVSVDNINTLGGNINSPNDIQAPS